MNSGDLIKISASLALVVIIILGLALCVRRLGLSPQRSQHSLRVLQRLRMGPRMQLMVIEHEDKQLVIGVTPHHISLLDSSPPNITSPAEKSFSMVLKNASKRTAAKPTTQEKNVSKQKEAFRCFTFLIAALAFFLPDLIQSQTLPLSAITSILSEQGEQVWSLSIETLVVLSLLTFIPADLIMMTGFTRIIIVLGLLRNAMGTGAAPPNRI